MGKHKKPTGFGASDKHGKKKKKRVGFKQQATDSCLWGKKNVGGFKKKKKKVGL